MSQESACPWIWKLPDAISLNANRRDQDPVGVDKPVEPSALVQPAVAPEDDAPLGPCSNPAGAANESAHEHDPGQQDWQRPPQSPPKLEDEPVFIDPDRQESDGDIPVEPPMPGLSGSAAREAGERWNRRAAKAAAARAQRQHRQESTNPEPPAEPKNQSPSPPSFAAVEEHLTAIERRLREQSNMPEKQKEALINDALQQFLGCVSWEPHNAGSHLQSLFDAAPQATKAWITKMLRTGLFLHTAVAPTPQAYTRNVLSILREGFLRELELESISQIARLDAAMGAYGEYVRLTLAAKLRDAISTQTASSDARISAVAQSALRSFDQIIESLSAGVHKRQTRLAIKAKATASTGASGGGTED